MPVTEAQDIGALIGQSMLLSPDRKQKLLALLPSMNALQMEAIRQALLKEYSLLADGFSKIIDHEVREKKNMKFATDLKEFLHASGKSLRKAQEEDTRDDEKKLLENIDAKFFQ